MCRVLLQLQRVFVRDQIQRQLRRMPLRLRTGRSGGMIVRRVKRINDLALAFVGVFLPAAGLSL